MLAIRSLQHLAQRLGLSLDFLQHLHANHDRHYRSANKIIGNKERRIYDPSEELRSALVPIKCLLAEVVLPKAIVGGRKGSTLPDFARPHVRKDVLVELDIVNFYPSTKHKWIYHLFERRMGCSPDVARILTRLATADGHIPQGFNTSTHLGNLLIARSVDDLSSLIESQGGFVTVWIDNIVVSGPGYLTKLIPTMQEALARSGYQFHEPRIMRSSAPQTICGITVNSNLSRDRVYREQIIAAIDQIEAGNICAVCEEFGDRSKLRQNLVGRIEHVGQVNPRQRRHLRIGFSQLQVSWDCRCR